MAQQSHCEKRPSLFDFRQQQRGKVVRIIDHFGFIKYSNIYDEEIGEIYFSLKCVTHSGHIRLQIGDEVSFTVRQNPPDFRKYANNVRLLKCSFRQSEILEKHLDSLFAKMETWENYETLEYITVAVTCLPVWECFGSCQTLSDSGVARLVEILLKLSKTECLVEHFTSLLETLLKSSFFNSPVGRFTNYIEKVVVCKAFGLLTKVRELILIIAKLVPARSRQLTTLIKPMISNDPLSCENFLYRLLGTCVKGVADTIENMEWNDLPLVPSVKELLSGTVESFVNLQRVQREGPYSSPEIYVDTYFRLLRADCFSALTKGVTDWLGGSLDSRDMNVYHGIRLAGILLTHGGSGMSLGLAITPPRNIDSDKTSNLMYGNLLCISVSGNFEDPVWATVVSRELLKSHQILVVELCSENNSSSDSEIALALYFAGPAVMATLR